MSPYCEWKPTAQTIAFPEPYSTNVWPSRNGCRPFFGLFTACYKSTLLRRWPSPFISFSLIIKPFSVLAFTRIQSAGTTNPYRT